MKNYEMIHLIQEAGLPKDAEKVVVRAFNKINDAQDPMACLTTSVVLCIALEYLGYSPKLCLGKIWSDEQDYYHAWTELDGKVIDVAVFCNSSYSPYWKGKTISPQVNKTYTDTDVKYESFVFDEDYEETWIAQAVGLSFYFYCENAPKKNVIWKTIMYCLDASSLNVLYRIKDIAERHEIGEGNPNW